MAMGMFAVDELIVGFNLYFWRCSLNTSTRHAWHTYKKSYIHVPSIVHTCRYCTVYNVHCTIMYLSDFTEKNRRKKRHVKRQNIVNCIRIVRWRVRKFYNVISFHIGVLAYNKTHTYHFLQQSLWTITSVNFPPKTIASLVSCQIILFSQQNVPRTSYCFLAKIFSRTKNGCTFLLSLSIACTCKHHIQQAFLLRLNCTQEVRKIQG